MKIKTIGMSIAVLTSLTYATTADYKSFYQVFSDYNGNLGYKNIFPLNSNNVYSFIAQDNASNTFVANPGININTADSDDVDNNSSCSNAINSPNIKKYKIYIPKGLKKIYFTLDIQPTDQYLMTFASFNKEPDFSNYYLDYYSEASFSTLEKGHTVKNHGQGAVNILNDSNPNSDNEGWLYIAVIKTAFQNKSIELCGSTTYSTKSLLDLDLDLNKRSSTIVENAYVAFSYTMVADEMYNSWYNSVMFDENGDPINNSSNVNNGDSSTPPSTSKELSLKDSTESTLVLTSGWNLISIPSNKDINPKYIYDLCGGANSASVIWEYSSGAWKDYKYNSISSSDYIKAGSGFWINLNNGCNLSKSSF